MSSDRQVISRLGAVILAAGDSSRMGRPKALLPLGGETFLGRWLRVLKEAGVPRTRVVLGRHMGQIREETDLMDSQVVVQTRPEEGMLSSLRLGMAALPNGLDGLFLCPVDHPLVDAKLLRSLADALKPGVVVVPGHQGRRGHPVLFSAALFPELMAVPLSQGARAVVRADPGRVVEVAAGEGVLADIDTPDEYSRLRSD